MNHHFSADRRAGSPDTMDNARPPWLAVRMEPTTPAPAPPVPEPADHAKVLLFVLVGLLAVAVAVLATVVALRGGGDDGSPAATPPPTPSLTTWTSTSPAPTSSSASSTSGLSADELRSVVWPQPGSGASYDDPVEAAATTALQLAKFTSPLVGPFRQGDARSGEVEIRPTSNGPVTTMLVRKMSDDHWYCTGAASDDLRLESPETGATVGSPVQVSGQSTAFEGLVLVTVLRQGDPHPLGQLPVQGGANGAMGPFTGVVHYAAPDVGRPGAIMLSTDSAKDGHVWQATIVPVMLAAHG